MLIAIIHTYSKQYENSGLFFASNIITVFLAIISYLIYLIYLIYLSIYLKSISLACDLKTEIKKFI